MKQYLSRDNSTTSTFTHRCWDHWIHWKPSQASCGGNLGAGMSTSVQKKTKPRRMRWADPRWRRIKPSSAHWRPQASNSMICYYFGWRRIRFVSHAREKCMHLLLRRRPDCEGILAWSHVCFLQPYLCSKFRFWSSFISVYKSNNVVLLYPGLLRFLVWMIFNMCCTLFCPRALASAFSSAQLWTLNMVVPLALCVQSLQGRYLPFIPQR